MPRETVTPYRRGHFFSYLASAMTAAMMVFLFPIGSSNIFAIRQVSKVDRKKPQPHRPNSQTNKTANSNSDSEGIQSGKNDMTRPVNLPGSVDAQPVVTNYARPLSKKRQAVRIKHDTGDDIPLSGLRRVYSASARPETSVAILVVRFSTEKTCGDSAYVYSYQNPRDILKKVLMVECVQELLPINGGSNGYPALIYVDDHLSDYRYMATLKFNGDRYEEESCKLATRSHSMTFVAVKCEGRGLVSW
jgi:hypothetical protein